MKNELPIFLSFFLSFTQEDKSYVLEDVIIPLEFEIAKRKKKKKCQAPEEK
jgi:hypothetical protein